MLLENVKDVTFLLDPMYYPYSEREFFGARKAL